MSTRGLAVSRIAILGGGITGLVAAYDLERLTDAEIDLYEASSRLGGKISTAREDDLTIEGGPDCFFARKPGVMELVRDLGIESELIEPRRSEFAMLVAGQLHRVPRALINLANVSPEAVAEAHFLSPEAKERATAKLKPDSQSEDESIRAFFTHHYGPEFSRLVAEPLLAGTHGGDPDRLSMQALYPAYLHPPTTNALPTGPTFLSFRGGMQALIDAVGKNLKRTRVHLNSPVDDLSDLQADRILVALPSNVAKNLLPGVTSLLARIPHRSSAIVTLAYNRNQIEDKLEYTGFLVPEGEHPDITGATWSSEKWPNRAPQDTVLIRVFMGGDRQRLVQKQDAEIGHLAKSALAPLLGISGEPNLVTVTRWIDALPQYELGHLDLVESIEAAMADLPQIFVAGTSYRGVGVPDCVRQGRDIARKIANDL